MATKTLFEWKQLFLILTVLPSCRSLQVSIPQKEYTASSGGEITLTCSFIPANADISILILTWAVDPENPNEPTKTVGSFVLNNPVDISPAYEGRAFLEVDIAKQVSTLRLTQLTAKDSRSFQCNVIIPKDDEGTTTASTSLLVLVPPSKPLCSIQGTAEYWHNITLTCESEEGSPKPVYEWSTYSVENIPRNLPPKATEKNGLLSLFNISRETSGFYICTSTNRVGAESCNLTLAVMPGSMNIGATAGIIGGVIAGLVVLGILIFCCCRKKSKKDKPVPREMQFYDKDNHEPEDVYWDDTINSKTKGRSKDDNVPQNSKSQGVAGQTFEDRQHGSDKEWHDDEGRDTDSNWVNPQDYYSESSGHPEERSDYKGSRDRPEEKRDQYGDSHDRINNRRDRYGGSGDRLDNNHDRYGGSRDRLDDPRDRYEGSRDRLDDHRDRYGGSRDRLDDHRDRYGGSRDRLDDHRDRYGGSRDRLDDHRDRYGGSRDRLDDQRDRYGGSRDRLDNHRDRYGGSRDRLDNQR